MIKPWWSNLALREKQIISAGAAILAVALIYFIIWSPLNESVTTLREQVQRNQALSLWMQSASQQIKTAGKAPLTSVKPHTAASMLSTVEETLKQNHLDNSISQLRQAEHDSVKLGFKQVDFDSLTRWLIQAWQEQNLIVIQATITSSTTPGMVVVQEMTLGR